MPTLTASRQDALATRFHGMHRRISNRLASQLRLFFRQQGQRVVSRYLAQQGVKAAAADIPAYYLGQYTDYLPATRDDDEDQLLYNLLQVYMLTMIFSASHLAADIVGGQSLEPGSAAVQAILLETLNSTRGITEVTRRAIQEHIGEGVQRGYSVQQVVSGILDAQYPSLAAVVESAYANRVAAIAQTETARAQSLGIAETYRMNGIDLLLIRDGNACGWTYHEDPDHANGSVRTVAEYLAVPLSHPYCIRTAVPYTQGRT